MCVREKESECVLWGNQCTSCAVMACICLKQTSKHEPLKNHLLM